MSYPQFVEVLSLLASSAAGRLRFLYPAVAGGEPCVGVHGALKPDKVGNSEPADVGIASSTRQCGFSAIERESDGASDVGGGEQARSRTGAGGLARKKATSVRAAVRLKGAR